MKTLRVNLSNVENIGNLIGENSICLGCFDGLHLGHTKLIKNAVLNAKYNVAVISFDRPFSSFGIDTKKSTTLMDEGQKESLLRKLGIDYFIVVELNSEFINLSVEDFKYKFLKKLRSREIFVGTDFTFAKNRSGKPLDLASDFLTNIVELELFNNQKISTNNISEIINKGDVKLASKMLGRNYEIKGIVNHGDARGRTMGFPTINVNPVANYVLPKNGVYKSLIYIGGIPHLSLTNIGNRPTFGDSSDVSIETYVIDFDEEIYGSTVYLEFVDFIRDEIKFENVEQLISQIKKDVSSAVASK